MDQKRIDELRKQTEERTELEQKLYHTIVEHFAIAVDQLLVAKAELELLQDGENTDERVTTLQGLVDNLINGTEPVFQEILDKIPGVMTREETEQLALEYAQQMANITTAIQNGDKLH